MVLPFPLVPAITVLLLLSEVVVDSVVVVVEGVVWSGVMGVVVVWRVVVVVVPVWALAE